MKKIIFAIAVLFFTTGCTTLSEQDHREWELLNERFHGDEMPATGVILWQVKF